MSLSKIAALIFTLAGCAFLAGNLVHLPSHPGSEVVRPYTVGDYARVTVKIMDAKNTTGGTGVILSNSVILTNKHICEAIQAGGVVIQDNNKYKITSYKPYPKHDLCMIAVAHDFGIVTALADRPPTLYGQAVVSGHPSLLPLVVGTGHYGGTQTITLIVDVKACDADTPKEQLLNCMFFGGIPVQQSFEAQLVTSTIKPGSSGSPVFNSQGELTNLAFASSSPYLDYAMVVPYSYVSDFYYHNMLYRWFTPRAGSKNNLFLMSIKSMNRKCRTRDSHMCRKYSFLTPEFLGE